MSTPPQQSAPFRPTFDHRTSTSRPAIRVRRLRAEPDGAFVRTSDLIPLPNDAPLAPNTPASPAPSSHGLLSRLRRSPRTPAPAAVPTQSPRVRAAVEQVLEPGEVARVVQDPRTGAAALAAVPEDRAQAANLRPSPTHAIPIPPASTDPNSIRPQTVLAVEENDDDGADRASRRSGWWPFGGGKKKRDPDMEGAVPLHSAVHPRDYAPGHGDPARQGEIDQEQYAEDIVDWLDVIDPEVATVSTLSNLQNSLFLPDLGGFYNRMPLIDLTRNRRARRASLQSTEQPHVSAFANSDEAAIATRLAGADRRSAALSALDEAPEPAERACASDGQRADSGSQTAVADGDRNSDSDSDAPRGRSHVVLRTARSRSSSSSSSSSSGADSDAELRHRERLMRSRSTIRGEYAVLPAGAAWDNWTEEERRELDDHVRHLMHSRRERWRRRLRGFGQFVKQPVGFFITLYAFLITFWGTAWVLFLIGWIYLGDRKKYFVEIADQCLTALFCVVGIGLAPFRAVDTYHMIYIAHYHRLTWRLRRERNLPKLDDKNDLPAPQALDPDLEAQFRKEREAPVLTAEQQRKLTHHQMKYHKSHTFYRPHETPTHRAFPLDLLIVITSLLDAHSMLQMSLGGTTWGINYHVRPPALTAVILCCSLSCNITAGIIIAVGTRRTRKVEEVEKRLRQALTEEAMARIEQEKKEEEKAQRKAARARRRTARKVRREEEAKARGEVGLYPTLSRKVERVVDGTLNRDEEGSPETTSEGKNALLDGKLGRSSTTTSLGEKEKEKKARGGLLGGHTSAHGSTSSGVGAAVRRLRGSEDGAASPRGSGSLKRA